jgi:hypothetical protein
MDVLLYMEDEEEYGLAVDEFTTELVDIAGGGALA